MPHLTCSTITARKYFSWSLLCEGTSAYTSTSTNHVLTRITKESYLWPPFIELSLQAKVTSFYLRTHAIIFMNWLRFECCFAFVVSFVGFKEGEGTLKCCQVTLPEDDYMVNPRIKDVLRPLLLCDEHVESRTTLFEGGDDVARPTVVTTSWSPTYAKSSWTPKVNPFLYASPLPSLLNGMLLHTLSHMHDRFTPTSTEAREEAQDIKPDKTEAWKR